MARSSNRDRIEHMAQEAKANAASREKKAAEAASKKATAAKKKTVAKKAVRKAAPAGRVKVVWLVCDHSGAPVETFPYSEEKAARAAVEERTEDSGKTHFVTRGEVPLE